MKAKFRVQKHPNIHYTAKGLVICVLCDEHEQRHVAFGTVADDIAEKVRAGDMFEAQGYHKNNKWTDRAGAEHSRVDFVIKVWRVVKDGR